jgi:hypothetical protein
MLFYALLLLLQGRFEILCLSGSYLVLDDGGTRTRSGGLCIALCGPDHRVIGGSVGGVLTAAGTVQVIASFRCDEPFDLYRHNVGVTGFPHWCR